jgi:predicted dehydrogenase
MEKTLNVGIVGAGLIGAKRAAAISRIPGNKVVACADADPKRAAALAEKYGATVCKHWQELLARKDIDVVVVAVPNAFTARIAIAALSAKKHVLCEKPFGINTRESRAILAAAQKNKRLVKAGFNHRFHPALAKAKQLFDQGAIGTLIFLRARYGHGGRKGMEKEWRSDRKIAGGGELLDQGAHVIDLMRWFGGEFDFAYGVTDIKVWRSKVEDNAFAILKNKNVTATFHVSTTNWGNIFSFEAFGDKGYLTVDGLGRWYGVETLKFGKRKIQFGDVKLRVKPFEKQADESWSDEWKHFANAIRGKGKLTGDGVDGLRANEIIEALYRSSRTHKEVRLIH